MGWVRAGAPVAQPGLPQDNQPAATWTHRYGREASAVGSRRQPSSMQAGADPMPQQDASTACMHQHSILDSVAPLTSSPYLFHTPFSSCLSAQRWLITISATGLQPTAEAGTVHQLKQVDGAAGLSTVSATGLRGASGLPQLALEPATKLRNKQACTAAVMPPVNARLPQLAVGRLQQNQITNRN